MHKKMIEAKNINKSYGDKEVLKGINLAVKKAEIISIVGRSGVGKSTLLHILSTLDVPDQGEVVMNGQNINLLRGQKLAKFRNEHIGFVFQFHNLLPEFSILENVSLPAFLAKKQKKATEERALELLSLLGVAEIAHKTPAQVSGGERQRAAIARALINAPTVVFADEPSGNLDTENSQELHKLFLKLREEFQQTFVVVTHDENLAELADRKIVMVDGLIVNNGKHSNKEL
ncbi:lipoprotein-releasing system ATP-binding protein LolD [Microscilla marina ATCC 23134]|uniref:Lipoprotein-releasing system ATP-binding protein LolD n=2 Tax=Microscilla marina TaxID=1027 RepID=A1ZUR7_MICM2|nr:lipoprotein-releasing system ATP-binding protein LolD [Microscilla marina ATCC 23134]